MTLVLLQWLIGFIFSYLFNPDAGNLGGNVGFLFGATTLLGFIGSWIWVPETKGRTAAQLNKLYDRKVSPRHFKATELSENM